MGIPEGEFRSQSIFSEGEFRGEFRSQSIFSRGGRPRRRGLRTRNPGTRNPVSVADEKSGVSRLCRLAAPGMMKMELGFGSLWLEAGVG